MRVRRPRAMGAYRVALTVLCVGVCIIWPMHLIGDLVIAGLCMNVLRNRALIFEEWARCISRTSCGFVYWGCRMGSDALVSVLRKRHDNRVLVAHRVIDHNVVDLVVCGAIGGFYDKALPAAKVRLLSDWVVRLLCSKVYDILVEHLGTAYDVLTVLLRIRNNESIIHKAELLSGLLSHSIPGAGHHTLVLIDFGAVEVDVGSMARRLVLGAHAGIVAVVTAIGNAILRKAATLTGLAVALPDDLVGNGVKLDRIGNTVALVDSSLILGLVLVIEDGLVPVGSTKNDEVRHTSSATGDTSSVSVQGLLIGLTVSIVVVVRGLGVPWDLSSIFLFGFPGVDKAPLCSVVGTSDVVGDRRRYGLETVSSFV